MGKIIEKTRGGLLSCVVTGTLINMGLLSCMVAGTLRNPLEVC